MNARPIRIEVTRIGIVSGYVRRGPKVFRVLDTSVKENAMCSMCGKKEPDQEADVEEFNGKSDLIIDWWDCQKYKR